jgi:hypothetical protein
MRKNVLLSATETRNAGGDVIACDP